MLWGEMGGCFRAWSREHDMVMYRGSCFGGYVGEDYADIYVGNLEKRRG